MRESCPQSPLRGLSAFFIESPGNDNFLHSVGTEAGEAEETAGQIVV